MEKYNTCHEILFNKFYYLGKKLCSDLMEVSKTLNSFSHCAQQISVLYDLGNSKELSDVYTSLKDQFYTLGKEFSSEAKQTLKFLPQYFNYTAMESQAYNDLLKTRMQKLQKFVSKRDSLLAKKEKLFTTEKIDKWELSEENLQREKELMQNKEEAFKVMLPFETMEVKYLEDTYLYLSCQ